MVALSYEYGDGVREDKNLAMEWYLKAANEGETSARSAYVRLKEEGYGTPSRNNLQ